MDAKSLRTLEYHKIIDRLASYTAFSASEKLARALRPTSNFHKAHTRLARTSEASRLLSEHPDLTIGAARDVRDQVRLAGRGGVLEAGVFLEISSTLVAARNLFRFFNKLAIELPQLKEAAGRLQPPEGLLEAIHTVLDDTGIVKDSASTKLQEIRRNLEKADDRAVAFLSRMINDSKNAKMLQEPIITKRANRYVIPIRAEYKNRLQCVVQDQSSSGSTFFVEPFPVVALNNERLSLASEEKEEVHRILSALSHQVGDHAAHIESIVHQLADLDLAFASARYGQDLKAVEPILLPDAEKLKEDQPLLKLTHARHPLLDPESVVPIDLILEKETLALVITGPNTGGKTISLKTAGLLIAMAQSGLHIPAQSGSLLCMFANVFAEIGDEQSIEQSLSTFSAHIKNIVRILQKADRNTLVLLDELGAGTDPQEGSALARAILAFLLKKQVPSLIATHYPELKLFAHSAAGVTNASVEFDPKTLQPTYRLLVGLPGRSNALTIAERLGISADIIQDAREMVHPDDLRSDDLLDSIQQQLREARQENETMRALRLQLEEKKNQLTERLQEIETERVRILEQARQDAAQEAQQLYSAIQDIRKKAAAPKKTAIQHRKELRGEVDDLIASIDQPVEKEEFRRRENRPLRLGDRVYIQKLDVDGIVGEIGEEAIQVQVGKMRMKVDVSDLERPQASAPKKNTKSEVVKKTSSPHTKQEEIFHSSPGGELRLLGERVEDALLKLERYLDAAYAAGLPYVRIVHGKGTGTLRKAVRNTVGSYAVVSRWERALDNEGGEGVTIVFLKDV